MSVKVDPQLLELSKSGRDTEEAKHVHDFFLALAACNTIVPLIVDDKSDPTAKLMDYQGESPDEQALAYAAAAYGFMLIERTSGHIIIDIHGERQRYIFHCFPPPPPPPVSLPFLYYDCPSLYSHFIDENCC